MHIKEVAHCLAEEFLVQSILCYGSYAQKTQDAKSDIDLLVILKEDEIPLKELRKNAYEKLPGVKILSLDEGENPVDDWDISWTPSNDRILVGNEKFDIGYNTKAWVETVIEKLINECLISFPEFPFRPYTFLGLLETSLVLYDQADFIKNTRAKIRPMPVELKKKIVFAFLPILEESSTELKDFSERDIGILAYQFHLFRALDAAVQLLFAINDVYDPASKRIEPFVLKLKLAPQGLSHFLDHILPSFYERKKEVNQFFYELLAFINKHVSF